MEFFEKILSNDRKIAVHLNLTYLLEVDENEKLKIKDDENSGVKWVNIEDVEKVSTEKWITDNIYKKVNEKFKKYQNETL